MNKFLLILLVIILIPACAGDSEVITQGTNQGTNPFIIENLGVTFGPLDTQTNRAGDFLFVHQQQKVFLEFGAIVQVGGGETKELPTFEYIIDEGAFVFAIAEGIVTRFVYQDATTDYEFSVRSQNDPDFEVGYDHVKNPTVSLGDPIQPGDTLGNPGTWSSPLGRFEIMINNTQMGLSYCPFCCFNADTADDYRALVDQLIRDWENFKGDTTIYDESEFVAPGCRYESMVTY